MQSATVVTQYEGDIVCFVLPESPGRQDILSGLLSPLDALLTGGRPFSVIIDSSRVARVSVDLAMTVARWMKSNRAQISQWLRGTAVIITNNAVHKILNLVFSVQKPTSPLKVVADETLAWEFIHHLEA